MTEETTDPLKLPDDLHQLAASLRKLKPSETTTTCAEMLFASGVASGLTARPARSSIQSSVRWSSFAAGMGAGLLTTLMAIGLVRPTGDTTVKPVLVANHESRSSSQHLNNRETNSVSTNVVLPSAIRTQVAGLGSEIEWGRLSHGMQRLWERPEVDTSIIQEVTAYSAVRNSGFVTAHELRRLAAETL